MLKRIYVNVPFLEALTEAPSYLKVLGELLSKKATLEEASVAPIEELCSAVLQSKSSSKIQDPAPQRWKAECYAPLTASDAD